MTSSFPPPSLLPLLNEVTSLLHSRNETVAVAETATGGLLSSCILSTPGSSKIYLGGLTVYSLASRVAYTGWTPSHLSDYRGPTPQIVKEIARNVRTDLKAEPFAEPVAKGSPSYVIAESGTAGPTGGETRNRRPGYVALAVDCEKGSFSREVETGLGGDRVANMLAFAEAALVLLRDVILGRIEGDERLKEEAEEQKL